MNWILKNKNKNAKALLIVLFFVFVFSFSSKASAATCDCDNGAAAIGSTITITGGTATWQDCNYQCTAKSLQRFNFNNTGWDNITSSGTTPLQKCINSGGSSLASGGKCLGCPADKYSDTNGTCSLSSNLNSTNLAAEAHPNVSTGADVYKEGTCGATDIECIFKKLLVGILNVVGWLMAIAATLFAWAIEPNNVSGTNGMLNKQAVKDVWIMVRDLLNMTFILILLFAAFCTIFQIDKWNLKKVWLNILINALLVNFSYPIARFFIDVSNVAFYYLVNNLFSSTTTVTGSSIFASLSASSKIGAILSPDNYTQYDIAYLVAMIVVVFIMGMTILVVAALFIVRLIALTMLVMFSPVGFVGYIFPSTASYADNWWKNLFKYSFFAPIMIFMMAISLRITEVMGTENFQSFASNATANAPAGQANWIAQAAFFSIPVIILWMGMGVANSMGIAGASTVVSSVKKGGKWLANNPALGMGGAAWKYSGIPGGTKKSWEDARKSGKIFGIDNKLMKFALKSGLADRESGFAGAMKDGKGGWTKARNRQKEDANKEDIKKKIESFDKIKMAELHSQIEEASNNPPDDRDKQIEAAAKVKQAMSRGASFEKEVEKKIIADIGMGKITAALPMTPDPSANKPTLSNGGLQSMPPSPSSNDTPVQLAQYAARHAEVIDNNRKAEAAHKESVMKWVKEREKLEKELIQEQKVLFMDKAREIIKNGEDAGKKIIP